MRNSSKIVHLTSVHPRYDTRIFLKECRSLAKSGYETTLLVADGKSNEFKEDVTIISLPKTKGRLRRILLTAYKIYQLALKQDTDLYHIHDPELLFYAVLLKFKGKKVIFDMHENLPRSIYSKTYINKIFRGIIAKAVRFLELIILPQLTVVFAEKSYKKDYKNIIKYQDILNMPIIDSINETSYLKSRDNKKFAIGYVGGVTEIRGSLTIINVISCLRKRNIEIDFHCIGPVSQEHRLELEQKIAEYDLKNISIYGYMTQEAALDIIGKCNLGIALLHPVQNYIESYPTKIFEYMSLGLPVLTSNFELYKDIIEDTGCGICTDPLDHEAIADAIDWFIEHAIEAEQMGKNGMKAVRDKYNWKNEESKLLNVYKQLLDQ